MSSSVLSGRGLNILNSYFGKVNLIISIDI